MADGGLKAPVLDWSAPDIAEAFRLFKQRINLYFKIKKTPEKEQAWQIVLNTGDEGIRRFNCWGLTEEEAEKPKTIFERFEEQLEPEENFRVCRLKLSKFRQLEKSFSISKALMIFFSFFKSFIIFQLHTYSRAL